MGVLVNHICLSILSLASPSIDKSPAAMGLLGHSPSRPLPPDADMQTRHDHHEHIRYPDVHQDPDVKRDNPSYGHRSSALPFQHESAQNQYQDDTAPLVSVSRCQISCFVEITVFTTDASQGYWMGLEAWRKTKGIASIDLRRPTCVSLWLALAYVAHDARLAVCGFKLQVRFMP